MEYKQVCENNHSFSTPDDELHFEVCPFPNCATKMHLELDIGDWKKKFDDKLKKGINNKLTRGKLIDSLPRLPWFSDALEDNINNPDQQRSHREWTKENDEELSELYEKHGISTHVIWDKVAEDIGRSLYAVERQLRITIANCMEVLQ